MRRAASIFVTLVICGSVRADVSSELRALTGERTVVVWMRDEQNNTPRSDQDCFGQNFILMGLDTDDGRGERVIQGEVSSYWSPMVGSDGSQVVWTHIPVGQRMMYCCNFDGSNRRELGPGVALDLWNDPETGVEWLYFKPERGYTTSGPVKRMRLDDPGKVEYACGTAIWMNFFDVSPDGAYAACGTNGKMAGIIDLKNDSYQVITKSCNANILPDNTYNVAVISMGHKGMAIFTPDGTKVGEFAFLFDGATQFPRWSNDPRFIAVPGPYSGGWEGNGPQLEIYIGMFKTPYTDGLETMLRLTNNDKGEYMARFVVGPTGSTSRKPSLKLDPAEVLFQARMNGEAPEPKVVTVTGSTGETLTDFKAVEDVPWLDVTSSGSGGAAIELTLSVNVAELSPSMNTAEITLSAANHWEATCRVVVVISGPYNGQPFALPGRIEAEEYDMGDAGTAYEDKSASNEGGAFRTEGVDIEECGDTGGGYNIGWTRGGEWLAYSVEVMESGTFVPSLRVASNSNGASMHLEFDGEASPAIAVPSTGGHGSWATVKGPEMQLTRGEKRLKVVFDKSEGTVNLNYLSFTRPDFDPDEMIRVLSPNGGESYHVGETMTVEWEAHTEMVPDVVLQISPDLAQTPWKMLKDTTIANTTGRGSFSWVVEAEKEQQSLIGAECLIRVAEYNWRYDDVSDAPFTIGGADNEVSRPPAEVAGGGARSSCGIATRNGVVAVRISAPGEHRVILYTVAGVPVLSRHGAGPASYEFRGAVSTQACIARVETGGKEVVRRVIVSR